MKTTNSEDQEIAKAPDKSTNLGMMEVIAKNDQNLEDIKNLTSSKVTDQLKVFLIAQARNELQRVVKLTEFLDKLESKFIERVSMEANDLTLRQYSEVISTITDLLSRSNGIISQVLKDESLTTILNTTIYSSGSLTTITSSASALKDPQSRERVRSVIKNVLFSLDQYPDQTKDPEVVDQDYEVVDEEGSESNE